MKLIFNILILSSLCYITLSEKPEYVDCVNSKECGPGKCCVLGMNRYSIPTCLPLSGVGDNCRPGGQPINTTVYYPGGMRLDLIEIYHQFSPCNYGLTCSLTTRTCIEQNELDNEIPLF